MTVEERRRPSLAGADIRQDAVRLQRTVAARVGLGPALAACDVSTFALAGRIARVPPLAGAASLALIVAAYHAGRLYRPRLSLSVLDDLPALVGRALAGTAAVAIVLPLLGIAFPAWPLLAAAGLGVTLLPLTRGVTYAAIREARRRGLVAHRTVVVGDGEVGRRLAEEMRRHPEYGLRAVGYLGSGTAVPPQGVPLLGRTSELARVVTDYAISVVVLAFGSRPASELVSCVRTCDRLRCDIFWVPRLFELSPIHRQMELLWGYPLVRRRTGFGPVSRTLKRALDIVLSSVVLLAATPVTIACAVAVRLGDGGPVFFRQRRLGAGLRPFVLIKFRTMREPGTTPGRVGRHLRAYSLDELPQLVNVLRGDMSLVGPRPEQPMFVEQFSNRYPGYRDRHRVRAGLTGWSQIHGLRGDSSIEDRARFDNQYIENWSLWEDIKIILRTVTVLVRHRGV